MNRLASADKVCLSIMGMCLFVLLPIAGHALHGQPSQNASRASEAARLRQGRVRTLSVEYKRTEVTAAGAITAAFPQPIKPKDRIPAKETTLTSISRLVIDGNRIRLEENHPTFSLPAGTISRTTSVSVFNGSLAKNLTHVRDEQDKGSPVGVLRKGVEEPSLRVMHVLPLFVTFRGQDPVLCQNPVEEMKPTGSVLPIDGSPCEEYVVSTSPGHVQSFWFDPSKDHVLRRLQRRLPTRLVDQSDITYRRDENWGWVPASWKRTDYSVTNEVRSSTVIEVLKLQINEPQPAEAFELQFAPGTTVVDERDGKNYVVQEDGSMRERRGDGTLATSSVSQPGSSWYWRNRWLLGASAVAILILLYAYVAHLRKKPVT